MLQTVRKKRQSVTHSPAYAFILCRVSLVKGKTVALPVEWTAATVRVSDYVRGK